MRINFKALGCRLNEAELESWARQFQADGHEIVEESEEADVVVFNSCAVTQQSVRKSRNLLRKTARENPRAKIVLSGCYATLNPDEAVSLGVDLVVANSDKHRLVYLARNQLALPVLPANAVDPEATALFRLGRHRGFVKVQDGCRYRCAYCIVTIARGAERSRQMDDIVREINALHGEGVQEAVLTGVHLGGYGGDTGSSLVELIRTVLANTAIPRLRLGSLEPWELDESFARLFENRRLMPHVHLPMQSGSDTVLKRMARRCRAEEFSRLAALLRNAVPDINITTDIIVGFPGETDAEWAETLDFAERTGFGNIHIFPFSPRSGTAAAEMGNPVSGAVKKSRVQALHELSARLQRAFLEPRVGRSFSVLWEGARTLASGTQEICGYTPNYLKVVLAGSSVSRLSYGITPITADRIAPSGGCLMGREPAISR